MGSAALKTSAAVGRLLRSRRKELRLTLRDVSERIAEQGEKLPTSTLVRVEQGKLDPGVRRLHLLLRLYDLPAHLVADLVDLEERAVEEPREKDLDVLYQRGVDHWKSGNIGQALAHLFAIRQYVPDNDESRLLKQKATQTFAILARDLGKLKLAKQLVDDLLCEPPDPSLISRVLVLASTVWRGLGSNEMALSLMRQAATHLATDDHQQKAWVVHQEAKLLLETGDPRRAERVLERAIRHYRKQGDNEGEARALSLKINVLEAQGDTTAALALARRCIRKAERLGHERSVLAARLWLGRLLIETGSPAAGVAELHKPLALAASLKDKNAEFYAHYYLWKAHEALGDGERVKFEFHAACYFVEFSDHFSPQANEIHGLLTPGKERHKSRR